MSTVNVEYVGKKPMREDTVAGTGTIWMGAGDVQAVPESAWERLSRHPDIWRLVKAAPRTLAQAKAEEPEEPKPAQVQASESSSDSAPAEPPAPPKNKGGRPKGSTKAALAAKAKA